MNHQKIKVQCKLTLKNPENGGMIKNQLNEKLRLFLSPWIQSEQTQIPMDKGIRRAELLSFLSDSLEVAYVNSINIDTKKRWDDSTQIEINGNKLSKGDHYKYTTMDNWEALFPKDEETIFVSANKHDIDIVNN